MESVFDSRLGPGIGRIGKARAESDILWRAYSMASVTPGDVVPKVDFIKFRGLLGAWRCTGGQHWFSTGRFSKGLFDGLPNPFGGRFEADAEEALRGRQSEAAQPFGGAIEALLPRTATRTSGFGIGDEKRSRGASTFIKAGRARRATAARLTTARAARATS